MVTPHLPAMQFDKIILVEPRCHFCKFWIAEADGLFGECISPKFAEKVYAKRDEGSPIMTAEDFHCDYWEVAG